MNAAVAGNDHELETIGSPDAAAGGGGMGGFMLNDGGETMEDISSMLFGDTFINLRVEVYPSCDDDDDDDDSEFTVILSKTPSVLKRDKMILQERYLCTYTDLPNFCVWNRFRGSRFRNNDQGFQTLVATG